MFHVDEVLRNVFAFFRQEKITNLPNFLAGGLKIEFEPLR